MRISKETEKNNSSLTPTMFNILVILSGGERHGYAILREVREIYEGGTKPGATSLYRSIRTMLQMGLIEELSESPVGESDDERRRYYRLTNTGVTVLNDEVNRLEGLLEKVKSRGLMPAIDGGEP